MATSAPADNVRPRVPITRFDMECRTEAADRECHNGKARCGRSGGIVTDLNLCRRDCACVLVVPCGNICKPEVENGKGEEAAE